MTTVGWDRNFTSNIAAAAASKTGLNFEKAALTHANVLLGNGARANIYMAIKGTTVYTIKVFATHTVINKGEGQSPIFDSIRDM
ncbi:hypothetical protein H4R18_001884 [Coemansia javaensis]|uniref:Uncharacterized protein n=1 Tax=Coemansia javaensis TaxID=2761396 RepID=A0A9W8LIJ5_9FUNG|nr:hypothetical protein H4R18_001884 [Coemansia javaensis]